MSKEITVKVENDRLIFGEGVVFPVQQVFVDHPRDHVAKVLSLDGETFPWITLWFYRVENGALICDVCEFHPKSPRFGPLPFDASIVQKIVLFYDSSNISALARFDVEKPPVVCAVSKPEPTPEFRPLPQKSVVQDVSFFAPMEQFCFLDGAVEIHKDLIPGKSLFPSRVCFRFENRFFSSKLNCLRPYLAKVLGEKAVRVSASVRVCGNEVTVEKAKAPALKRISSELINQVRFNYVKGELKRRGDRRITTVSRFFGELSDAGFDESDADFIADVIRAKNLKHSEHIEYLSGLHDAGQVRLRLIRDPFSFLFFIPRESGCFFAWETIDGTDATYLWKLKPLAYYLAGRRGELKKALTEVEHSLDLIYAAGRNEYLREEPSGFFRIFHDYEHENGFELWRKKTDGLFNGAG